MKKGKRSNGTLFTVPVIISTIVLGAILFTAIFAPLLAAYDPDAIDFTAILASPSKEHWLGTDATGRDQFTRLMYGGRTSMINGLLVVLISVVLGVPLGLICGFYKGWADNVIMRVTDFILSFPPLLLAIILVAGFGRSGMIAVVACGIVYTPGIIKLMRSLVLTESKAGYVEACQSMGYTDRRIMFRHILPNCVPTLIVEITLDFGYAIVTLASMSFLGIGVQAPQSDWGTMLEEGFSVISTKPALAMGPAAAILLVVLSVNILSDGIQRYLDPGQRKLPSFERYRKKHPAEVKEI